MKIGSIDYPQPVLDALRTERLVVFAGAGVSMGAPANLPSFWRLAEHISAGSGLPVAQPLDQHLGQLATRGVDVTSRAVEALSDPCSEPTELHVSLLRLFGRPQAVRIVTTNFDQLFQKAVQSSWTGAIDTFRAPALPVGNDFSGIVHVHGSVTHPDGMVLTDSDFGRAYLTEGWARRFLLDVFQHHTVLFLGYSHQDIVLQYLARALPVRRERNRFVLEMEGRETVRWHQLGIEPIFYPPGASDPYSELYAGVRRLADLERRGALDLQRDIAAIASKPPPLDEESSDQIRAALLHESSTRYFTRACTDPAWLDWLDKEKVFEPLFSGGRLEARFEELGTWLTGKFVLQHPYELMRLLGRHHLQINEHFWLLITQHLGLSDPPPNSLVFERWMRILLDTAGQRADSYGLRWLAERAEKLGLHSCVVQVFGQLVESRLRVQEPYGWPAQEDEDQGRRVRIELAVAGDHSTISDVWSEGVRPHLRKVAGEVFAICSEALAGRYAKFASWQAPGETFDRDSYGRSAIEPHPQDEHPESVDVIVDAARESLEMLSISDPPAFAWSRNELLKSHVPLLRRLGIHAFRCSTDVTADQKIASLFEVQMFDVYLRHEVFQLLRSSYADANVPTRRSLIAEIQGYQWPDVDDENRDLMTDRVELEWLWWLRDSDASCALVREALEPLEQKHPQQEPSEYPDLLHWHGSADWVPHHSPLTVDELLSRAPSELLDELLSFRGVTPFGADRSGLCRAVTEAAKSSCAWGLDLAKSLTEAKLWHSDLGEGLLSAWRQWPDDTAQASSILAYLEQDEVHASHAQAVADALCSIVEQGGKPYALTLLERTDPLAKRVWEAIQSEEELEAPTEEWLQAAINRPAGKLAEYVFGSVSVRSKSDDGANLAVVWPEGMALATAMVSAQTIHGGYARSVFASQLAFFLFRSEAWAREHLVPLFSAKEADRFCQAWDGFLTWGRLTPRVVEVLKSAIISAVPRVPGELPSNKRRFVEYYAAVLVWYAEARRDDWLPGFILNADAESRRILAGQLDYLLRGLDPERQRLWWTTWLRQYWEDRLQGLPAPLLDEEITEMLEWPLRLSAIFEEAVMLAGRMRPVSMEHCRIPFELRESKVLQEYPESAVRYLTAVLNCDGPRYIWHGTREAVSKIPKEQVNPELWRKLEEALARRGLD